MPRRPMTILALGVVAVWAAQGGCTSGGGGGGGGGTGGDGAGGGSFPVTVTLDDDTADFVVTADEPTEKIILLNLDIQPAPSELGKTQVAASEHTGDDGSNCTISGGTISFEPGVISFEPEDPDADVTAFDFQVTGFAIPKDPIGACGAGDQYGPYTIGIGADGRGVSVDPLELTLLSDTVQLICDDNLAICLRVLSPVSGIIRIEDLRLRLTAGAT